MSKILGYKVGELNYKAAFTSDITMDKSLALQEIVDAQEVSRRIMDTRPGMYLNYIPGRFDSISAEFQCGGRYLFDTWDNAVDYDHWTSSVFKMGDEFFWSWSGFKKVDRWIWRVIGAHNFTLPDAHAVGRFQRWTYTGEDAERILKEVYPVIREAAKAQGLGVVWVLHQPEHRIIGIHTVIDKITGPDVPSAAHASVSRLEQQLSLERFLPAQLQLKAMFDKTNLLLGIWLPLSRLAGGVHQATPNTPAFPAARVGV